MRKINVGLKDARLPNFDGEIIEYSSKEAIDSGRFDRSRKVVFINGMKNSPSDHAESALALSLVQMCTVIGVYNKSSGFALDLAQCLADKDQFNGPLSFSADNKAAIGGLLGRTPEEAMRTALKRNSAQVALFDLLRRQENRHREIFAHSQGNLILSNVLQAIEAADGPNSLAGYVVHTFGSPAVKWPAALRKQDHGFTWDPVTFLAGFDATFRISKVGMPSGSLNPITHGFLEYLKCDAAFVVNRFRWGGLGVTFNMDEAGLAACLAAMEANTPRVLNIFEHLNRSHNSDADDVAFLYVELVKKSPATLTALKAERRLVELLIRVMDEGWTTEKEKDAIAFLREL